MIGCSLNGDRIRMRWSLVRVCPRRLPDLLCIGAKSTSSFGSCDNTNTELNGVGGGDVVCLSSTRSSLSVSGSFHVDRVRPSEALHSSGAAFCRQTLSRLWTSFAPNYEIGGNSKIICRNMSSSEIKAGSLNPSGCSLQNLFARAQVSDDGFCHR